MQASINTFYPNRIQLALSGGGPGSVGPLGKGSGAMFDPRLELEFYQDGVLTPIVSFAYDAGADQYLLFTAQSIPSDAIVQILYHVGLDPVTGHGGSPLPGFALLAALSSVADAVDPVLGVSVSTADNPAYVLSNTFFLRGWNAGGYGSGLYGSGGIADLPGFLLPLLEGWSVGGYGTGLYGSGGIDQARVNFYALGIAQVEIVCPALNYSSGLLAAKRIYGSVLLPPIGNGQTVGLTISAFDASGSAIQRNGFDLQLPFTISIASP